jgi:thiol-disulfide isomerase/thioredoxin
MTNRAKKWTGLRGVFYIVLLALSTFNTAYALPPTSMQMAQNAAAAIAGTVTDVINTTGFTYVEVETPTGKVWAAGIGNIEIKKGAKVSFTTEMPMSNFHSKNLNRDFALIYFVKRFDTGATSPATNLMPPGHMGSKRTIQSATLALMEDTRELNAGDYLREASLDGLQGEKKMLSDFKGKPLLINVWASWCGPCQGEMGSLENLSRRYNGKQFNIIGISTDDYRDKAQSLIRKSGITFANYLDNKLMLEKMLGAKTIPLTILVDESGRILQKVNGARAWDSPEMVAMLAKAFQLKL